jgi:hypothetical protein
MPSSLDVGVDDFDVDGVGAFDGRDSDLGSVL